MGVPGFGRRRPAVAASLGLALLAVGLLASGCQSQAAWELGVPGAQIVVKTQSVVQRSSVLDVRLANERIERRVFTRPSEGCRQVFAPDAEVDFANVEPFGLMRRGDAECSTVGIGDLTVWRDSKARASRPRRQILPRAQSHFEVVYQDEDVTFALGRFPLTGFVGWAGGEHTVAVLPRTPECEAVASRGVASMEFRPAGRMALTLVAPRGQCVIAGLIRASALELEDAATG